MSHFTVMVIGNNPIKQLEPYNEQTKVPEYCREQVSQEDLPSLYYQSGYEIPD